jgi:hypothetical protein
MAGFDWAMAIAQHRVTASEVLASTWLKPAPKGGSEPQVWDCGDEGEFYVKHPNNPQDHAAAPPGSRVLAAEQIVGTAGNRLGAPLPPVRMVGVAQDLIDAGNLHFRDGRKIASVSLTAHYRSRTRALTACRPRRRTISRSVTAKNRKLWVWTLEF